MKVLDSKRWYLKPALMIVLLVTLLGIVTGCESFGQFPAATSTQNSSEKTVASSTVVDTKDKALLAVYEHLLSEANSPAAKLYLADFYENCNNWKAESEFFKDGSGTWYVLVDMTDSKTWKWKPYWIQASWFVFKDGKVIPSYLLQANALRIEADLQELSPTSEPQT